MRELASDVGKIHLMELPHQCPFCHKDIAPTALFGHKNNMNMEVFMNCPSSKCKKAFIGYYTITSSNQYHFTGITSGGTVVGKDFSPTIKKVSPIFITVYNQSITAEQQNLLEVCGIGYRKALEILIKEYALLKYPDEKLEIEKKNLSRAIEEFVDDVRVRSILRKASWLGNDDEQYVRRWEGKNLLELKKIIDLTIHWIEMEELSLSFDS